MPRRAFREQARLGRKIIVHTLVIIEVVAAQVREDRRVDAHTVDASLRQCVRRDLDGRIAGALFNKPREAFLHFDHGRGRHALAALQFAEPVTQGAQISASLAEDVRGLRDHPRDGRLAVGARHADHLELLRRVSVKAIGYLAEPRSEVVHGDRRHANVARRRARRGVPRDGRDAGLERFGQEVEAVRRQALNGQEQVALVEPAAVAADAAHGYRRRVGKTFQQVGERRPGMHVFGRHAHWRSVRVGAMACMTLPGSRTGSASGGTASRRSDSDITSANTGAATSLP